MQSLFCLPFHMNKTSVIAVLLFTFECQLNLTEKEDPGFSPEGRSHSVRIAWQKSRSVGADFLQAQTGSWPASISKMVKGRHWRELSILMHKEHGGRTGEGALHHAQHREHNESKHQIVATWMRGEEAWGKILGKPDFIDLVVQEAICSHAMSCHVLFMVNSTGQLLHNLKES